MKYTATKLFRALCGMVVMLALVAGITSVPALAASNGIYIAAATPHYKHPTTGKIEDAGGEGSAVLGQSMTESATYKKALVEVDPQGNTYVTIRLQLMDNIQNPKFQVDGSRNGSFISVSASLMQEDYSNNTADYRIKVPSENAIIRCNMYVTAMGRDVIFYITVSNFKSGSGDFITSVTTEQSQPAETHEPETSEPETSDPETETSASESTTSSTDSAETDAPSGTYSEVSGLQEFDINGDRVTDTYTDNEVKSGSHTLVWWVIGGVVVMAAAGFGVRYFRIFKKKK